MFSESVFLCEWSVNNYLLLERVTLFDGSVKFVLLESVLLPRREGRGIKTGCCRAR